MERIGDLGSLNRDELKEVKGLNETLDVPDRLQYIENLLLKKSNAKRDKPRMRIEQSKTLLRAKQFIPEIAGASQKIEKFERIDEYGSAEDGPYIKMNLGIGVFDLKPGVDAERLRKSGDLHQEIPTVTAGGDNDNIKPPQASGKIRIPNFGDSPRGGGRLF